VVTQLKGIKTLPQGSVLQHTTVLYLLYLLSSNRSDKQQLVAHKTHIKASLRLQKSVIFRDGFKNEVIKANGTKSV